MSAPVAEPSAVAESLPETPYVGLVPYREQDAAFFFGRDEEKQIVAGNLRASRLTILYGPSGVGKTSLLQAGVVHDLHEQVLDAAASRPERAPSAICIKNAWRDEPLPDLLEAIRTSAVEALGGQELALWRAGEPPVDALRSWTERVRTLLVVLDQFEDYFLYHPDEDGDGTFATELPRIVNEPNLRVNFLVSIREDAWAKLDRFEGRIPALFGNYVRVEHLDRRTGAQAIEEPVAEWNRRLPSGEQPYVIKPTLTAAVLDAATGGRLAPAASGAGADREAASADAVEAPFLQLVMERLWRATVRSGERDLSVDRLEQLGGAQRIVESHLLEALGALSGPEQAVAADLFRFLVTRAKTKIAHPASNLAEWTKRPEPEVAAVLDRLCRGESGRVLRALSPSAEGAKRYELFHDVLAEPVLEWRRGYEQRRDRRRALRIVAGLAVLVVVFAALGIYALGAKLEAERGQAEAEAAEAAANSLALASSAGAQRDSRLDLALLLGLEAYRQSGAVDRHPSPLLRRSRELASSSMILALDAARSAGLDTLVAGGDAVRSVALSRDGSTLAAIDSVAIRLWDLRARKSLGSVPDESGGTLSVALSADGSTLATVAGDGSVRRWDVGTLQPRGEPQELRGGIDGAAFAGNLKRLATIRRPLDKRTAKATVEIWDLPSKRRVGKPLRSGSSGFESVALSADGRRLATVNGWAGARVWSARTRRRLDVVPDLVTQAAFAEDGRTLVYSDDAETVRMYDMTTKRKLERRVRAEASSILSLAVGGRMLAVAAQDGPLQLWDLRARASIEQPLRPGSSGARDVEFSRDGGTVAAAVGPSVRLWDAQTREPRGRLRAGRVPLRSIALSPDGRRLATAGGDTVTLWDVRARTHGQPLYPGTGELCKTPFVSGEGPLAVRYLCAIKSIAFSPDGRLLAAGSPDNTVRLWDVPSGDPRDTLRGHEGLVRSVAFSPDGRTLVSGSYDGTVRLWRVREGSQLAQLPLRGAGEIFSVAFSPDGRTVAAGGANGAVVLWDAERRKRLGTMFGRPTWVLSLAFSPDGRTLASGGADGAARLWEVGTRQPLGVIRRRPGDLIEAVAFSPDGHTIATAEAREPVTLWPGRGTAWKGWADLREQVCDIVLGNLTDDEWNEFAPDVTPQRPCPA